MNKKQDKRVQELAFLNQQQQQKIKKKYWAEKVEDEYEDYWALPLDCDSCNKEVKPVACGNCLECRTKDIYTQDYEYFEIDIALKLPATCKPIIKKQK